MKRVAAFSSFGVTALVLALIVMIGFRTGGAQGTTATPGTLGATSEAHFPFLGITRGEAGRVHVVNLSADLASPSLRFLVMFIDHSGMLIKPEQACDVRAGETCSATLTTSECVAQEGGVGNRCEFRALVVPEILPCPPVAVDGGVGNRDPRWSTDFEVVERREGRQGRESRGSSRLVLGPSLVMAMPVAICQIPNPDGGVIGNPDVITNPDGGVP